MTVFTLGYQGLSLDLYVQTLKEHKIDILVDVREVAWSRKPGFSKGSLSKRLERDGIMYLHLKTAGNPLALRRAALTASECLASYRNYLSDNPVGVSDVIATLKTNRPKKVCLTCFEHEPVDCHRSILTEKILELHPRTKVVHLKRALP